MTEQLLSVRLCQMIVQDGAAAVGRAENFKYIERVLAAATEDLVVFPEACTSGFPYRHLADAADANAEFLSTVRYSRTCVLPMIAREGKRFVNRTFVLTDGSPISAYDKIHLIGLLGEDRFLSPGSDVMRFSCGSFRAGLATCYDLRFPELFRSLMLQGVQLFVVPAMWPVQRADHLLALARARAIENQAFVAVCNAAGSSGALDLCGQSAVFDPRGNCIVQAADAPLELTALLDLDSLLAWRVEFPVLKDARLLGPSET